MYFDDKYEEILNSLELRKDVYSLSQVLPENLKPHLYPKNNFVYISYGKWNIYNMESFVSMIAVWKIKSLDLSINEEPRILNQLYHIDFPYLTEINLNENNIESVQKLSKVNLPLLNQLWLDRNKITKIKNMRKMSNKLALLSINNNPIEDFSMLSESTTTQLEQLSLEYLRTDCAVVRLCQFCKLEGNNLRVLDINSAKRILEQKILSRLAFKFQKITVYANPS